MTVMAILQEVDKCMRCNGCAVACKREWHLKQETIQWNGVPGKVAYDQRLAIKSQKAADMGPFLRFSCWHCPDPPCAKRCPKQAIFVRPNGAVDVHYTGSNACDPSFCKDTFNRYPCVEDCGRGGYPKPGLGSNDYTTAKMQKCTLCSDRAGGSLLDGEVPAFQNPSRSTDGKTRLTGAYIDTEADIPELLHEPSCVQSCPAKAMTWDTRDNVVKYLRDPANGYTNIDGNGSIGWYGNGSMFWASKKALLAPPKADPFVEDHLSPLVSGLFSSPLAKAAIVPTLLAGGLLALSARRTAIEEEVSA